mmetsp:Transcript_56068/g.128308  ORF Transcript_56068/g.128308 Transcript_56068/m.128308 type:complete len:93 (+) Transcript_56068:279-557(+)
MVNASLSELEVADTVVSKKTSSPDELSAPRLFSLEDTHLLGPPKMVFNDLPTALQLRTRAIGKSSVAAGMDIAPCHWRRLQGVTGVAGGLCR